MDHRRIRRWVAIFAVVLGIATLPAVTASAPPAAAQEQALSRVSWTSNGQQTSGPSTTGAVSADGRWGVFLSSAPELSTTGQTVAVSGDILGKTSRPLPIATASNAMYPTISADGSTIAFTEIGPGGRQLRIVDRSTLDSFVLSNRWGGTLEVYPHNVYMSPNGRQILFAVQRAYDIAEIGPGSSYHQAAVFDRATGQYTVASMNSDSKLALWYSYPQLLSGDGRFVWFVSDSPNLPNENSGGSGFRLFRRDIQTSTISQMVLPGAWWNAHVSENGRYAAAVSSTGITVADYETGQMQTTPLPAGVLPSWCPEFDTRTYVSNDAKRFVFITCRDNPFARGMLWSFDTTTGRARQIAAPDTGDFSTAGDLHHVIFDAPDGVVADDTNGHSDVFAWSDQSTPAPQPKRYVALGDSFSSGEGTFDYFNTQNSCHRSKEAYPYSLAEKLSLGEPVFAACSGAVTDDFYSTNPKNTNELRQLDLLTKDTEIVTLTVGGNDAGFAYVLDKCVNRHDHTGWGCSEDKSLRRYVDGQLAALAGKSQGTIDGRPIHSLLGLYRSIHERAPQAKIYVAGYPRLFGTDRKGYKRVKQAPSRAACFVPTIASLDYADAVWLNKQADRLNKVISDQVEAAKKEGIKARYVTAGLFAGHGLCDSFEPWINEVVINDGKPAAESFHPTSVGHHFGYAAAFRLIMERS